MKNHEEEENKTKKKNYEIDAYNFQNDYILCD